MRDSKGTTLDVFNLLFHAAHYWLELGISIQQHHGFSRTSYNHCCSDYSFCIASELFYWLCYFPNCRKYLPHKRPLKISSPTPVWVMSIRNFTTLDSNLGSETDLKRHSLCCCFGGDKTFTTHWSGGQAQV